MAWSVKPKEINTLIRSVRFDGKGLVPVIVQDYRDKTVLMMAYMNRRSLRASLREGAACFWSRSRQKLWRKGEQSGNRQLIKGIRIDCDGDCLLLTVKQIGRAACHTGHRSCFLGRYNQGDGLRLPEGDSLIRTRCIQKGPKK